jgi:hypothetical protein
VFNERQHAEGQLNIAGTNFHLYLFKVNQLGALVAIAHRSWPAGY